MRRLTGRGGQSLARTAETWLWTGRPGHLVGGAIDFLSALAHYARERARRYARR